MMVEKKYLDYYYTLSAPSEGGEAEMTMVTGHSDTDEIKNYYINDDINRAPEEYFSIYPDGLIVFFKRTKELIEVYSNKEFDLHDDGIFYLVR